MTMFTIDNQIVGWDEVVIAAQIWGEWQLFFESVRHSLACLQQAEKFGQMPPPEEVREASTAFRYAHNLISAEETQDWLYRWGMTVEDWMNYLRGQLLLGRWAGQFREIAAGHPISDEDVAKVIKNHAVCADKLRNWAIRLARHAAVAVHSDAPITKDLSSREWISRIEADFEIKRKQAVTPRLIETKINDHRLDWILFDCRYLWFADERIAREAAWCVSEDGLSLDEVAAEARGEVRQWQFYADEIEASVRPYFLAARQGALVGPLKIRQGYPLFSLLQKKMPAADDPQILARAEQAILNSFIEQAVNERVSWLI